MEENLRGTLSGWIMFAIIIIAFLLVPAFIIVGAVRETLSPFVLGALLLITAIFMAKGLFTLQPNEARVLVLFGKYVGTVKQDGFHWANPFSVHHVSWERDWSGGVVAAKRKYKVSLRARNFETPVIKVNDQRGNPIEIGAVVVWAVRDTAKALFDVDDFEHYVQIQSETAIRHLANRYAYDHATDDAEHELTLRDDTDTVSAALEKELGDRLARAGVIVQEARLTHLAYAPEIAGVMLRRQQAEAIIAARKKIVHGAVSMVQMALEELSEKGVVTLDEPQKATMVGNLLVVLCGEAQAEPVINAGAAPRPI